jgi:hypothetical protein
MQKIACQHEFFKVNMQFVFEHVFFFKHACSKKYCMLREKSHVDIKTCMSTCKQQLYIYIYIYIYYVYTVVQAHSRACPRGLVSSSFPCCIIARRERGGGRGGGKSDSTGSTAAAGPPRMLIIASQASVSRGLWVLTDHWGGFAGLLYGCTLLVRLRRTPTWIGDVVILIKFNWVRRLQILETLMHRVTHGSLA